MKSDITEIKLRVNALLEELECLEANEPENKEMFPLSELKQRYPITYINKS